MSEIYWNLIYSIQKRHRDSVNSRQFKWMKAFKHPEFITGGPFISQKFSHSFTSRNEARASDLHKVVPAAHWLAVRL